MSDDPNPTPVEPFDDPITEPTNLPKPSTMPETIKETSEVIAGAGDLIEAVLEVGEDGYQVTDAGVIITDGDLREALMRAARGANQIPAEMKDLTIDERTELMIQIVKLEARIEKKIKELYG